MTSWLAIFGWFLVASAFGPACLFLGIVIVSAGQWVWFHVYDLWLDWQEARFEKLSRRVADQMADEAEDYLRSVTE